MAATRRVGLAACALVGAGAWGIGVFGAASPVFVVLCGVAALFAGALAWRVPGHAARAIAVACLLGLPGVVGVRLAQEGRRSYRVGFEGWGQKGLADLLLPLAATAEVRPDIVIQMRVALCINLTKDGRLIAQGQSIDLSRLRAVVKESKGNPWPVVLRVDRYIPWRTVEWVLAEVKAAGRDEVLLAARTVYNKDYAWGDPNVKNLDFPASSSHQEARPFESYLPLSLDSYRLPRPGETVLRIRGEQSAPHRWGSEVVWMPSVIDWEAAGTQMDDFFHVAQWMRKQPSVAIRMSPGVPYLYVVATIDLARREGKDYTFAKTLRPAPESVRTQSPLPFPKGS